jgi:hypothetical protein
LIALTEAFILNGMSREELHRLVDSLPEDAMEPARQGLEHLQIWPPPIHPELEQMRLEYRERILKAKQRNASGGSYLGGGGEGGYSNASGGRMQNGHLSFSHVEENSTVVESLRSYHGYEIAITERLRMSDDGKSLHYTNEIAGPGGKTQRQEITFDAG